MDLSQFQEYLHKTERLVLIPNFLGWSDINLMSQDVIQKVHEIQTFIVENEKSSRAFLKTIGHPTPQNDFVFYQLDKRSTKRDVPAFFKEAKVVGLLSDAGVPCVADPGKLAVSYAHENGIKVEPLIGPSSILLALMGSGFNGQNFAFHGYLPHDRKERHQQLRYFEKQAQMDVTHLFMETPYRNGKFLDEMLKVLRPDTKLCIACNLTTPEQYIETLRIEEWKVIQPDLNKKPTVFAIGK